MSGAAKPEIPFSVIESRREELEQIAASDLPVAEDADRVLNLLSEHEEEQ